MNPLESLRDIHAAPPPPWWPPAPGWWVLGIVALLGLVVCVRWLWRLWQRRRAQQRMRQHVEALRDAYATHRDLRQLAADASVLLRQLAIVRGGAELAARTGEGWTHALDRLAGAPVLSPFAAVVERAPYQRAPDYDPEALLTALDRWVQASG